MVAKKDLISDSSFYISEINFSSSPVNVRESKNAVQQRLAICPKR